VSLEIGVVVNWYFNVYLMMREGMSKGCKHCELEAQGWKPIKVNEFPCIYSFDFN